MHISEIMGRAPIIPVLEIAEVGHAVPLARALVAGGLPILEVTLRTDAALAAIEAMARDVPEAVTGVGTATRPQDFDRARDVGAHFVVSPGISTPLLEAATRTGVPFLPGIVTPAEILMALAADCRHLKFFPAEAYGGVKTLKAFHGPFPDVRFCPTGGIRPENYLDYLSLPNVLCVGGTWLAPNGRVERGEWSAITELAARVSGIRSAAGEGDDSGDDETTSAVGEEDPGAAAEDLVDRR